MLVIMLGVGCVVSCVGWYPCMVCVHLLSSRSICLGMWGISFCRLVNVMFSLLAIFSLMCV